MREKRMIENLLFNIKVLDLFSGSKSWSQAFRIRGHEIITIDNNEKLEPDICVDIMNLKAEDIGKFEVVLASPPCNHFSVASISKNWTGGKEAYIPKTKETQQSINLVKHTLDLIKEIDPQIWIMENPMGVLRKLDFMQPFERKTITYCQYGENRMKPTDLWGKFPSTFQARRCKNNSPCHERAPRGAKTGTQGIKGAYNRAKIPYQLSLEICVASEKDL
jgi:hypothetical protein